MRQAVDSGDVEHISVFAIAPIPLLVYLGWQLDDKTPTRIFQSTEISSSVGLGRIRVSRWSLRCLLPTHRATSRTSCSCVRSRVT
ncbi:hypothetical protein V2I01_13810 [Micromonospora sp. BRA006-A]|nr:hypothetical protein [Micromonospora sp. BRA006-A]